MVKSSKQRTYQIATEENIQIRKFKKNYNLEEYLKRVRNPAHEISMTKLRSLRMQTGKCENKEASIPVEEKLCIVCKRNYIENEKHFLMHYMEYDNLRQTLFTYFRK